MERTDPPAAETSEVDYSDLGFPGKPDEGWPTDPYDEDGYCAFCYNGSWKFHGPWCQWADARDADEIPGARPDHNDGTTDAHL